MKKLPGKKLSRNEMKHVTGGGATAQGPFCSCIRKELCPPERVETRLVCLLAFHVCCYPATK